VTQREYFWITGKPPSYFKGDAARPVEQVSWDVAVAPCKMLNDLDRDQRRIRADQAYQLPTEAEWEYAARAGSTGARYAVDGKNVTESLDLIAWHSGNSGSTTNAVKGKQVNTWGLYDMMGNVYEWCSDWYGGYPTSAVTDLAGPGSDSFRVFRGGSWISDAAYQRSANRNRFDPGRRRYTLGFRPALSSVK